MVVGLRTLLQLALVQDVERRAEEHVAAIEDLVEERVDGAEHAFIREVLRAPRRHEGLEVDRPDEVGLDRALGELPREDARLSRALIDDASEDGGRDAALCGSRRARHEDVLARKERERDLRQEVVTFDERPSELFEESREPFGRSSDLGRLTRKHRGSA